MGCSHLDNKASQGRPTNPVKLSLLNADRAIVRKHSLARQVKNLENRGKNRSGQQRREQLEKTMRGPRRRRRGVAHSAIKFRRLSCVRRLISRAPHGREKSSLSSSAALPANRKISRVNSSFPRRAHPHKRTRRKKRRHHPVIVSCGRISPFYMVRGVFHEKDAQHNNKSRVMSRS